MAVVYGMRVLIGTPLVLVGLAGALAATVARARRNPSARHRS